MARPKAMVLTDWAATREGQGTAIGRREAAPN